MVEDLKLKPASWQATVTTTRCDRVEEFVTIIVGKDWSVNCTWYNRYKREASGGGKRRLNAGLRRKIDNCSGPLCPLVVEYRSKLIQEESGSR